MAVCWWLFCFGNGFLLILLIRNASRWLFCYGKKTQIVNTHAMKNQLFTFGQTIRQARINKGLSLHMLAQQIGWNATSLGKMERNQQAAPANMIAPLAEVLGLTYKALQIQYLQEQLLINFGKADYFADAVNELKNTILPTKENDISRQKTIHIIKRYMSQQAVDKVWIFGSFARNTYGPNSDIDLLVQFSKPKKIDLFDYVGIKLALEDLTGRAVDLVEQGQELPQIKPIIEREKQLIYERKAV